MQFVLGGGKRGWSTWSLKVLPTQVPLLAGILRYKVDLQQLTDLEEDFNDIDLDDYM